MKKSLNSTILTIISFVLLTLFYILPNTQFGLGLLFSIPGAIFVYYMFFPVISVVALMRSVQEKNKRNIVLVSLMGLIFIMSMTGYIDKYKRELRDQLDDNYFRAIEVSSFQRTYYNVLKFLSPP